MKPIKIILFFNNLRGLNVLNFLSKKKKIKISKIVLAKKNLNKDIIHILKTKRINYKILEKKKLNKKNKIFKEKTDLYILCGFPYIIKKNLFKIPKFGTLNLHAGPLPQYRGGSPLNWQIINGEKKIGLSIIKINQTIDGGPLLVQRFFKLKKNYDIKDVHEIANKIFPKILFSSILKMINQKNPFISKSKKKPRYFNQRSKKDGRILWKKMNDIDVYNFIRAQTKPYPGAYSFKNDKKKVIIYKSSFTKKNFPNLKAGQVFIKNRQIFVKTKKKFIKINNKLGKLKHLELLN